MEPKRTKVESRISLMLALQVIVISVMGIVASFAVRVESRLPAMETSMRIYHSPPARAATIVPIQAVQKPPQAARPAGA